MADTNKLSGGKNDSMFPQGMMTVRQMGDLLGLTKTERYWLIHKGYFKTTVIKEQIFVDIDSFEKWYANQLTYKKITGEEPGAEISKNTYSISEAAEILHVTESTVYIILKDTKLQTVEIDHRMRIPKDVFDKWYTEQIYTRDIKTTQNPIRTMLLRESAPKYISVKEASEIAGISRQALIKHLYKGHIDYVHIGMLMMWGVFSEMERDIISQRVKSGMKNAAAKGKQIGRPKTTADNIPGKFWKYYSRYKTGDLSVSELARLMDCSRTTVYKYINMAEK